MRAEFGSLAVPCAPLVEDEAGAVVGVGLGEDAPVVGDDVFHEAAAGEQVVVLVGGEGEGRHRKQTF